MNTDIKTEAEGMVAKFRIYCRINVEGNVMTRTDAAKQCAIIHCNGIIKALKSIIGSQEYMWSEHQKETMIHYQNLIEYIQKM